MIRSAARGGPDFAPPGAKKNLREKGRGRNYATA